MRIACFAAMLTFVLATSAGADTPIDEAATGAIKVVVRPGETAGQIARAHGLTVKALCAANGLTNPNRLYAGQTLVIPTARAPGGPERNDASAAAAPRGPVGSPRRAAETVVTEVADLTALAAAPTVTGAVVVRPAPLTRRRALDASRAERFGVARTATPSARRAAIDVVGPFRD